MDEYQQTIRGLSDRIELAKPASNVAFDVLEFELDGAGVEAQRATLVIGTIDGWHLLATGFEKGVSNGIVPLHRVEDTNRCLRQHNSIGQNAYRLLVIVHPKLL